MKTKLFLLKIKELKKELSEKGFTNLGDWNIDVINPEFKYYDMPITELIYCIDTLDLFPTVKQYDNMDADEDYYFWGVDPTNGYSYALDQETDEILLIDRFNNNDIIFPCVANQNLLLEVLYMAAVYFKDRIIDKKVETNVDLRIEEISKLAGGEKYKTFVTHLLG